MFKLVGEEDVSQRGKSILGALPRYHKIMSLEDFFHNHDWANKATFHVEKQQNGHLIGLVRQSPHRIILLIDGRLATRAEADAYTPILCSKAYRNMITYISQFLVMWGRYSPETNQFCLVDVWDKAKLSWATSKRRTRWYKQMKVPFSESLAIIRHPRSKEALLSLRNQFEYPINLRASYKDKIIIVTLP